MDHKDLCEHTRIRLIAAAVGHQQCTKTAGTEVQIPGTDKRILIGNDAYLAKVAGPAAVFQNDGREPDWDGYAAAEAAQADERLEMLIHEITGYEGEDDAFAYLRRALSELMEYRRVSDVAHAQQEAAPKYTLAIGIAADRYHASFKSAPPLPAGWLWNDLWDAMIAAAVTPSDAKDAAPTTVPDHSEREAATIAAGQEAANAKDAARPEDRIDALRTALLQISETTFGWDGDCGVTRIADDALYADEQVAAMAAAPSSEKGGAS